MIILNFTYPHFNKIIKEEEDEKKMAQVSITQPGIF